MDLAGVLLFWRLLERSSACTGTQTVEPVIYETVRSMMDGREMKGRKIVGSKGMGKKDSLAPLPP